MIFTVKDNVITATENIENGDGTKFMNLLTELESEYKDITLKVHSGGGSVFDGNLMYNAIQNSKATIRIEIIGICASMFAIIALSVEEVYIVENGFIMIHASSGGVYGTAKEIETNAKILRAIEKNFIKKLINKTGKSEDYVRQWLEGDNWFDAEQSLQEGFVKGIINPETSFKANFNPNEIGTQNALTRFSALFNSNFKNNSMNLKSQLISKLNLKANTSDTKVMQEVEEMQEFTRSLIELLGLEENATNEDITNSIKELLEVSEENEQEQQTEASLLIQNAQKRGFIKASQVSYFKNLFKADFKGTKDYLISLKPQAPNLNSLIVHGKNKQQTEVNATKPKTEWTLDDYRKLAPQELGQNPKLYAKLVKQKFN